MRLFLTAILSFNFFFSNSQNLDGGAYASSGLFIFGITSSRPTPSLSIKGSQYFDEKFKSSFIKYYNKKLEQEGYMRYNAFNDEIEIASTPFAETSETALLKEKDLVPVISGESYIYLPHRLKDGRAIIGYLIEIYKGNRIVIYEKRSKIFMEEVKARTSLENSFPPRYIDNVQFYISINGNTPILIPNRKKEFLNLFKEKQSNIAKFMKDNKLNIKNLESIIEIFKYSEQIN